MDVISKALKIGALVAALLLSILHPTAALAAPPANDDFDGATVVSALPAAPSGDTSEATTADDDPEPGCVPITPEATVWYSFTPSEALRLTGSTFGSDYDTILAVYTGTRGALTQVACNDDAGTDLQSRVTFDAAAGTTYYFMISSYDAGGQLTFSLERTRVATALRLTTSKTRVYAGEAVRVVAHLDAFQSATDREISIYATPSGGSRQLVASGPMSASGDFAVAGTINKTTTFVAEWAGDEMFLPARSPRRTVYFGVKSGSWFGSTRQGWIVEFRVENGTRIPKLETTYEVRLPNCNVLAVIELDLRFRRPVPIRGDRFRIEWKSGPIAGVLKGTFTSRTRIRGTLSSTINDRASGCRGNLTGMGWHASHF